ncbi:pentatricopeptide repeat-containing protein At4g13650-like [Cicer arietinum]|uniref:Pentatricopeptide repeat-containing protein At3g02330, mitochondrial-like n=1 Tax=Cicer arietinum TaxID=3827 RepID=A0A1S2YZ87_CICAR|nr:pentatricopeptide repeat-containing protein At3g02330, mitochondrial-like [Cicer arietinum]
MIGRALLEANKLHAVIELEPFLLSLAKKSNPITLTQCNQIHAKLIITQCISQTHLANTLLSFYSKSANFRHAHQLFDKMPHRNVVTWTTLISSHLKNGSLPKAFEMFNHMRALDERPNEYTFSVLLRACANPTFFNVGLQIHGLLVHCGIERDKFAGSSLVYLYFKGGNDLRGAWRVFYGLLERDVVAWNVMISGFVQVGDLCMVQSLFSEMWDVQGLKPDNSTFVSLLKCCSFLQEVKQIHGLVYKFGAEVDVVVESAMVDLYAKCGDVSSCRKIFDSMEEKDNFVWSSMISGYTMNKRGEEAVQFFKDMCRQRVKLDQHVLSSTVKACVEIENLESGVQVHGSVIKNGHQNDCFVASVLMNLYASFGELGDVEKLFRRINNKDIVTWNSMILAQARPGRGSGCSMQLLQELRRTTLLQIEGATLVAVLKSCENESDLPAGRQIHSLIVKSSMCHHTLVGNALVHMYSECKQIGDAFKAFVDIVWKDDSSWSSIIGTCKQNGMESEALVLCKEMLAEGINFTSYSLPLCISACSQLSAICEGKQLHVFAIKSGYNRDVYVGSSIIDMYAKCGNMEESEKVFEEQLEPNEVTFNAMICGYAHHGKAQQAIEVLSKLEKNGVTPNHVTFLALMSACSHAGYVEETLHLFTLMIDKYKIKPKSEHYSCLVDAYGRAGRLEEAYQIVQKDGSESAWRTLLGACRNHNNTEIGEKSAMKMLELNPSDHAPYILLSNLYMEERKWEEALKCREKMATSCVKKDPGSSWLI